MVMNQNKEKINSIIQIMERMLLLSFQVKIQINLPDSLEAPIKKDTIVGSCEVIINGKKEYKLNIKVSQDIERNDIKVSSKKALDIWQKSGDTLLENILKKLEIL